MSRIKDNLLLLVALLLALAGLTLSLLLSCKAAGVCQSSLGCSIEGVDGCAELADSQYSRLLGLPIAYLGLFYYAFLTLLLAKLRFGRRDGSLISFLAAIVVFGAVFDIFLAYRNFFQLAIPCLLCAYTYICQAGILALVLIVYLRQKSAPSRGLTTLFQGGLRSWPAIAGSLLLTVLFYVFMAGNSPTKAEPRKEQADPYPLLKMSEVATVLRDLRALKSVKIEEKGLRSYEGSSASYINIHKWVDFGCPHCYNAGKIVRRGMKRWPGRIRTYYRYFPLDGSCNPLLQKRRPDAATCRAAYASICAAQGENFSAFYHGLFEFQVRRIPVTLQSLKGLIRQVGEKEKPLLSCMGSKAAAAALQRDIGEAAQFGLKSTPTLVLNGHLLPAGTPREDWFFRMLDALVLEKEGESAIEDYEARKHVRDYTFQDYSFSLKNFSPKN